MLDFVTCHAQIQQDPHIKMKYKPLYGILNVLEVNKGVVFLHPFYILDLVILVQWHQHEEKKQSYITLFVVLCVTFMF